MKTCIKCNEVKDEKNFRFYKARGYFLKKCLSCINEMRRAKKRTDRGLSPDSILPKGPKLGNRKPKTLWSEYPKEQRIAWNKKYKLANKEKIKEKSKQYLLDNYEKRKLTMKLYREKTKDTQLAYVRKRQASKMQRTPIWVDIDELWLIKEAYSLSALRTKMLGFIWHVDHIVPLQGKLVSGLHTIVNLQVIPAIVNMSKHNRFEVNP